MAVYSEDEALELGLLIAPEDLPVVVVPTAAERFGVGAYVQARLTVPSAEPEGEPDVVVSEFTVTALTGDVVTGSPLGVLDGADGWSFEVIRQAPIVLPQSVRTTITANLTDGTVVTLTGKGRVWMNDDGDLIDPDSIRSFVLAEGA